MANNKMTAKTAAAKAEEVKAAVKETAAAAKVEEVKTVVKETAAAAKEATANATAAVKETAAETKAAVDAKVEEAKAAVAKEETKEAVKETAKPVKEKKPSRAAKKAAAKEKEELKPEVFVQYQGKEAIIADVVEKAKGEFVATGHRVSSIKSLQVYLKPEEFAAYYVINQKFAGRVDLF